MSSTAVAISPSAGATSLTTTSSQNVRQNAIQQAQPNISKSNEVPPSPGQFQHPRITEIVKRRAATTFTEKNVQTIALNIMAFIGTFITRNYIQLIYAKIASTTSLDKLTTFNDSYIVAAVRLILLFNIFLALRPKIRYFNPPDSIEDIPLTPSQRALVGLPSSRSTTPQSTGYTTPTRYRHTSPSLAGSTPQSANNNLSTTDRRSISANYSPSSSSLFTSRFQLGYSPASQSNDVSHRVSGSPFSPSSPLLHKTLDQGGSLRRSQSMRERLQKPDPATPSPKARERTKMQAGLNYKWIYERGLRVKDDGSVDY